MVAKINSVKDFNLVSEADRLKQVRLLETDPRVGPSNRGAWPRPSRKKGFWRAVRRGEMHLVIPPCFDRSRIEKIAPKGFARYEVSADLPSNQLYISWPYEAPLLKIKLC